MAMLRIPPCTQSNSTNCIHFQGWSFIARRTSPVICSSEFFLGQHRFLPVECDKFVVSYVEPFLALSETSSPLCSVILLPPNQPIKPRCAIAGGSLSCPSFSSFMSEVLPPCDRFRKMKSSTGLLRVGLEFSTPSSHILVSGSRLPKWISLISTFGLRCPHSPGWLLLGSPSPGAHSPLTLPNPILLTPARSSMQLRGGSDASSGGSIFLALPVLAPL
jgi:hypothetical protein